MKRQGIHGWGDVNKYLPTPDITMRRGQRNDSTNVQLIEIMSLLGLLTGTWATKCHYITRKPTLV